MFDSWPWWAYLLLGISIGLLIAGLMSYFLAKMVIGNLLGGLKGGGGGGASAKAMESFANMMQAASGLKTTDTMVGNMAAKKHEKDGQLVWEISDFLTAEECDELIEKGTEAAAAERFSKLVRKVTGVPQNYQGPVTLKRYQPGEDEGIHTDAIEGESPLKDSTVSVYLSEGAEAATEAATEFPKMAGLKIQPEKGKAIFFYNLDSDGPNAKPAPESAHIEHAPATSDKWVATIWTYKNPPPALKKADVDPSL